MTSNDDKKFRIQVLSAGTGVTLFLCGLVWFFAPRPPDVHAEIQKPEPLSEETPTAEPGTAGRGGAPATSSTSATTSASAPAPMAAREKGGTDNAKSAEATTGGGASGQGLFQKFCAQCHGDDGRGDTQIARMMRVKPPNLRTGPFRAGRTPDAVTALIRDGKGSMPGFAEEISPQDAKRLADYVLSLEGKGG